jgi:mono/diheme cytochrome c family protein
MSIPGIRFARGRFTRYAGGPLLAGMAAALALPAHAEPVSFNNDIRPLLSNTCFQCHGPDEESRKAGLRLDLRETAFEVRDGVAAIVPGKPEESSLLARITHADPDELMPPKDSGKELKPEQIALIRQWIAEGADWPTHWAFETPQRLAVPVLSNTGWVRNPIDTFILARLEKEGFSPSPEADAVTLLRRLHLDITGLPPTLDEIDRFQSEPLDAAYPRTVDDLLDSPHYGERWARNWLDAAQFADSDGFEKDKPRQVWAWRDYVINAFNNNVPYDQFVTEQVAGDLLPNATQEQQVATGFLRNSMINEEGGIDPEQFRMEAMFNRMDVIGRAVMGLTVQCAQCHTHKYDPLTHHEYYQLMAYVNNSHEACMTVYTEEERAQRDTQLAKIAAIDAKVKSETPDWRERMESWAKEVAAQPEPAWQTLDLTFDDTSSGGQKWLPQGDGSFRAAGYAPTRFHPKMTAPSPTRKVTAIRLELMTDPNLPRNGPGRSIYGSLALSEFELRVGPKSEPFEKFDAWPQVKLASAIADVNPPERPLGEEYPDRDGKRKETTGPVDFAIDGKHETAWTTDNGPERRNQPRYAILTLEQPLEISEDQQLGVKLIQVHGGWNSDDNQNNNVGRFRISVTDAEQRPAKAYASPVIAAARKVPSERSAEEETLLFQTWRMESTEFALANIQSEMAWNKMPDGDTQLVYQERESARQTHRLDRGDFLQPREPVTPGVPAFLHEQSPDAPPNRLGLAQWLVDKKSPTTARTFVNRLWQHYFGSGIVATSADLGSQSDPPSHPELLDWLAVEFMDSGWDIKHIQRLIVSSAAYRQSSRVTPELLERDPGNHLIARGSRFRVEGEIVRDIALAASGLLNPEVGGPSVYPRAPMFLFEPPASYGPKPWKVTEDSQRYRRGLYTFRYRSVPYPALQAFDAPPGDAPCTRRVRSNTPLQALTTLNEPGFVECAQALAATSLAEGGGSDEERLVYAFRRCAARAPEEGELQTLNTFLAKQRERIAAGHLDPKTILTLPEGSEPSGELAAWTLAARVMLNMDEAITRE